MSIRALRKMLLAVAGALLIIPAPMQFAQQDEGLFGYAAAHAGGGDLSQKEAFQAAKELGTIDAWDAFLKSFPTGFRADLARAYKNRLGGGGGAPASAQTSPAPSPSAPPAAAPQTQLSNYAAEAGTSPWSTTQYEMDEGNASETAAAVQAGGLEFLLHCDGNKRLAGVLRESERGVYPEFDQRIAQGLDARRANGSDQGLSRIPMGFSSGRSYSVSAVVQGLTGEVSIGEFADGSGFKPDGKLVKDLMSDEAFTLFAPPFEATFQLTNSRKSICAVVNKCGAAASGCGSSKAATTSYKKKKKRSASSAASACYDIGMAYRNGQCVPKTKKARKRAKKLKNKPCPAGMYRNPYGNCQPNETGG